MKKLLKPSNIAFYFLMFFVFFFVGIYMAGIVGAGKNQMLAGGAIVLGWGVMFAVIAFLASFFIALNTPHKTIVRLNWILLILLVVAYGITHFRYLERQKDKEKEELNTIERKKTRTTISKDAPIAMLTSQSAAKENSISSNNVVAQNSAPPFGIGFFKPNYFDHPTLYFYGDVNLEKGILEHMPIDSIVFANDEYGNPSITYAPPWLSPEHLKLDYNIILFKVLGLGHDFVKVEVNKQNKQVSYLDKYQGSFVSWPEFLLSINSVEFLEINKQTVHVKPLDYAGEVNVSFDFMQALLIENEWMYVKLLSDNHLEQGVGWIKWKSDNMLLIAYSLLS